MSGSFPFATSSMIQAAHAAPAASRCHAVCFLPPLRSGPVSSGRAGRTACARRIGRGRRRASSPPSPSFLRSALLRCVTSAPADTAPALRCARQAAGLASTAARTRQSLALGAARRVGDPAPGGRPAARLPLPPRRSPRPGPQGPALAVPARSPSLARAWRCARSPSDPNQVDASTDAAASLQLWGDKSKGVTS